MAAGVVTALLQKSSKCSGVLVLPGTPAVLDKNTSWLLGGIRPQAAVLLRRNGPGLLTFTDLLELLRKICLENCNETIFVLWQLKRAAFS